MKPFKIEEHSKIPFRNEDQASENLTFKKLLPIRASDGTLKILDKTKASLSFHEESLLHCCFFSFLFFLYFFNMEV